MDRDTENSGEFGCSDCGGSGRVADFDEDGGHTVECWCAVKLREAREAAEEEEAEAASQLTVEEARAGYAAFLAASETSFEDLLDTVWLAERNWRLDDRLALAVRLS